MRSSQHSPGVDKFFLLQKSYALHPNTHPSTHWHGIARHRTECNFKSTQKNTQQNKRWWISMSRKSTYQPSNFKSWKMFFPFPAAELVPIVAVFIHMALALLWLVEKHVNALNFVEICARTHNNTRIVWMCSSCVHVHIFRAAAICCQRKFDLVWAKIS